MNNIAPSMLPIAPPARHPNPSCANEKELPDDGESFDSLLQQMSDEPADEAKASEPVASADEKPPPIAEEKPDTEVQAGIMAMFGLPALVPLPEPVPTFSTDAAAANPVEDDGSLEPVSVAPEPATALPAPPLPTRPLTTFSPTIRQAPAVAPPAAAAPVALPTVEADPESKDAAPPLEVANVLGIIPPVQQAPVLNVASTAGKTRAAGIVTPDHISAPLIAQPINSSARNVEPITTTSSESARITSVEPAFSANPSATSPAIPATGNEQPIAAPAVKPVESTPPPATKVISEAISVVSLPEKNTGMMAAKPGSDMSAPTLQRSTQPTAATAAEAGPGEIAPVAAPMDGMRTLRTAPVLAAQGGREHSTDDRPENTESPTTPMPGIASPTFPGELVNTMPRTDGSAPVKAADVVQVVTHTLQGAERLIASGQERVALAVKLDNGSELTIHLRVANGQVIPIIRTESEPLRVALEQNWSRFSQRGGENELRITTPVFESPQTSSNMSDPHQQREGRQRTFNESATEFYQNPTPRRNAPPTPPRPATPLPAPAAGVHLYA